MSRCALAFVPGAVRPVIGLGLFWVFTLPRVQGPPSPRKKN